MSCPPPTTSFAQPRTAVGHHHHLVLSTAVWSQRGHNSATPTIARRRLVHRPTLIEPRRRRKSLLPRRQWSNPNDCFISTLLPPRRGPNVDVGRTPLDIVWPIIAFSTTFRLPCHLSRLDAVLVTSDSGGRQSFTFPNSGWCCAGPGTVR
jgi:hypothetical protein